VACPPQQQDTSDLRVKWPSAGTSPKSHEEMGLRSLRHRTPGTEKKGSAVVEPACVEATRELILNPTTRSNRCSWPGIESFATRLAVHPHLGPDSRPMLECIFSQLALRRPAIQERAMTCGYQQRQSDDFACALARLWCEERFGKGP
jgi:hypothetical protein